MNKAIKNWKTTVPGVILGIANVLPYFGVLIPQDVLIGISAIAVTIIGIFAKDSSSTGV